MYIQTIHTQVLEKEERSKYKSTSGRREDGSFWHLEDKDKSWFLLRPEESLKPAVLIGVLSFPNPLKSSSMQKGPNQPRCSWFQVPLRHWGWRRTQQQSCKYPAPKFTAQESSPQKYMGYSHILPLVPHPLQPCDTEAAGQTFHSVSTPKCGISFVCHTGRTWFYSLFGCCNRDITFAPSAALWNLRDQAEQRELLHISTEMKEEGDTSALY